MNALGIAAKNLAEENQKARVEGIHELFDKLTKYYTAVRGNTYAGLVAYHVKQVAKDMVGEEVEDWEARYW